MRAPGSWQETLTDQRATGGNDDRGAVRKLHVLLVTSDRFPPFRPASEAIFRSEFTRRGHRVDWLMPAEQLERLAIIRFGKGVVIAAPRQDYESRVRRALNYLSDFVNDLRAFALARRHQYDVIQVKDKYVTAVFCLLVAKLRKVPFCFWLAYPHAEANLHGARHKIVRYPLFYWFRGKYQSLLLYKLLLPAADHVFVQSEQMRVDIGGRGIDPSKMTPIPGSLDLAKVPYKGADDPGPGRRNILYVGTLIRERRLDFLIRAFAKLASRHGDTELVLVGAGENPEDEELLVREIERTGLDPKRVIFAGRVPREQVWQYIEESTVCVSPYYPTFILNSTSPTKLLEYMAMGRPVVANEHPEQSLVIGESGAGIAVPWDEQRFADAMTQLLDDPARCHEMGMAGRKWVEENRSNRILSDTVESIYAKLLVDGEATKGHRAGVR